MFELKAPRRNMKYKKSTIMFDDISISAKEKVLKIKGVNNPKDAYLDVMPVAYIAGITLETQDQVDEEVLSQMGYYRIAS